MKSLHLITPAPRGCLCVHRVRVSDSRKTKTHLEEGKTEVPHASPTAPHPQFLPQAHSFRGPAGRWFLPRTPRGRVERDDPTHVPVPAPAAEAAMHLSSRARGSTPAVSPNPRGRPTRHSPSTNPPSPTPATAQHPAAQASPQALASRLHAECGGGGGRRPGRHPATLIASQRAQRTLTAGSDPRRPGCFPERLPLSATSSGP